MIEYLVSPSGQYVSTLQGTAEELIAATPQDHYTVLNYGVSISIKTISKYRPQ